jgi:hypothetical protein
MIAAVRATPASVVLAVSAIVVAWVALILIPMRHEPRPFILMWIVMSVAMMIPTVLRPLRRIAHNSPERATSFLLGYVCIWTLMAFPAYALMQVSWTVPSLALLWLLVGLHQAMPWTHRALHACRRLDSNQSAWRSGLQQGRACVIACAPVMIVAMLTVMSMGSIHAISVAVMCALTLFMVWEKQPHVPISAIHASALVFVGVGIAMWLTSGSGGGHVHI